MSQMLTQQPTYEFPDLPGQERLRELILYISQKCLGDPHFGAVKLNKILFYADVESFARYGTPITGVQYRKFPFGPVPEPLSAVRAQMVQANDLAIHRTTVYQYEQQRTFPLRDPDLTILTGRDIALIDEMIERLYGQTAQEISEQSHNRAWRAARDGEPIAYEAVFLSDEGVTDDDIRLAHELDKEFGWNEF